MADKYFRANPYLGCEYEITKKEAMRKINSRWWVPVWDDYWLRFCDDAWYDTRDPERSWIFRREEKNFNCMNEMRGIGDVQEFTMWSEGEKKE